MISVRVSAGSLLEVGGLAWVVSVGEAIETGVIVPVITVSIRHCRYPRSLLLLSLPL